MQVKGLTVEFAILVKSWRFCDCTEAREKAMSLAWLEEGKGSRMENTSGFGQ